MTTTTTTAARADLRKAAVKASMGLADSFDHVEALLDLLTANIDDVDGDREDVHELQADLRAALPALQRIWDKTNVVARRTKAAQ